MKPLYIFDLDGTLALIDHRRHFINDKPARWKEFFAACVKDEPNAPVIRVMEALRLVGDVWIFSGRSDEVRSQTVDWLTKHTSFTHYDLLLALMMRMEGDYTPDDELKQEWLRDMLTEDRERIVAVFDDRDRVVQMWRRNGIACFQVAEGEF